MKIPYVIDSQIHPDARAIKAALTGDLNREPFTEEKVLSVPGTFTARAPEPPVPRHIGFRA